MENSSVILRFKFVPRQNMNCLTCQMVRSDSDKEERKREANARLKMGKLHVERSWSGNLAPAAAEVARSKDVNQPSKRVIKKPNIKRIHSSIPIGALEYDDDEPKLVRSCGVRRDWSLEDLRQPIRG